MENKNILNVINNIEEILKNNKKIYIKGGDNMAFATWYKIVNYTIWFFRYLVSTIEKLLLHMLNKVPCYKLITFK